MSTEPATEPFVIDPPMIRLDDGVEVTLRQWAERTHGPDAFEEISATTYGRAAAVPAVFSYFHATDMDRQIPHFAAAFALVSEVGITPAVVEALRVAHEGVRDRDGHPITPEIFDAVVATLGQVLAEAGTPQTAIEQVVAMTVPLRAAIAVG